jgi:RimJ/RimL family protein N-acetyltransferase
MLTLRLAGPDDEDRLLAWRNHASVREASFSRDEISAEDHHLWFSGKLRDPDCALLIIDDDGRAVGQIRLDRLAANVAEVSISLAAEARGRHVGREALRLCAFEASRLLGVVTIVARVRQDNEASLAAFRAAGYRVVGHRDGVIELQSNIGESGDERPSD